MTTYPIELSDEQMAAADQLLRFDKRVQTLGGYAGTGKTTLIRYLQQETRRFAVCAYTGKAADVLRQKDVPASTIHSLIYSPYQDTHGNVQFRLNENAAVGLDGFIVDEASMVDRRIHDDLLSFDLPVIFVGDHGQLEPVSDEKGFNLMAKPDITLETIHRNAGEIARFGEFVRKGNEPKLWPAQKGARGARVHIFKNFEEVGDNEVNQFIVAKNSFRVLINKTMRDALGYPEAYPVDGDRIMCLQNNHKLGLFNGQQGIARDVNPGACEMTFVVDDRSTRVRYVREQFNREKRAEFRKDNRVPFDYCYAVTCHKAQGSEWDQVCVFEFHCSFWSNARWMYTAASRAKRYLFWIT